MALRSMRVTGPGCRSCLPRFVATADGGILSIMVAMGKFSTNDYEAQRHGHGHSRATRYVLCIRIRTIQGQGGAVRSTAVLPKRVVVMHCNKSFLL